MEVVCLYLGLLIDEEKWRNYPQIKKTGAVN